MAKKKRLSSSFSTGGGGVHFEAHVQASFVALMLTGGHAPCLPCWPIKEIKLQGKIDGFETDDLIVVVGDTASKERRKLLGQVKHSISITKRSALFAQVAQAAWNDFNNPELFRKDKDQIALITGPLSATDARNVQWLLSQVRHTKNVDEFFRNVRQANFSPPKSAEKLEVIRHHLDTVNGGARVSKDELYSFLKHFHLLGYDLGRESGVVLSLLHSHISQFQQQHPQWVWSRVVDIVQTWNRDAGVITPSNLPDDLLEAFKRRTLVEMPEEFRMLPEETRTNWAQHPDATYLALAVLIGAWQDRSQGDHEAVEQLLGIGYVEWLKKAQEILQHPDSPLSLKNGRWKVVDRTELWNLLASRILDHNLDTFKSVAVSILKEPNPAFELQAEQRYAASIQGRVLQFSQVLREGIAEGLAILGTQSGACSNCSQARAEEICVLVIRELLTDANWARWGSLNTLVSILPEAAPDEFLSAVEMAMRLDPCPFDELFSQEGDGFTGGNYLTGLLWALEGLAWDKDYLVRVCVVLGELASHDPGGKWANRPFDSLATVLLPWMPQTLASVDKRKVALLTILNEWPDIAWNLIIQLLPGRRRTSSGSHKPHWRNTIPEDWEEGATDQEYRQQVSFYAELAVTTAGQDTARLTVLIDCLDNLTKAAFDQLLQVLTSKAISELPEEERLSIWEHLTRFAHKHRRFSDTEWSLPEEPIARIEGVAAHLAPTNPFNLYQHLFSNGDFDLYDKNDDLGEQQKKLDIRRVTAVSEIYQLSGTEGVVRFAESVSNPGQVGNALGGIADSAFEQSFLPHFLDSSHNQRRGLAAGFIWRRYHLKGWDWCDGLKKSCWKPEQVGRFLTCLPFSKEAWDRASAWLQRDEGEYWTRTGTLAHQIDSDLAIAIEKLIEHGRPHAAIDCLIMMRYEKQPIDASQCVRVLLAALSSQEPRSSMDEYQIVELIKLLQAEPSVDRDDLFRVEWAYISILDGYHGASPQLLEGRLASDPDFFCEVIRLIYRPKDEDQPSRELSEGSKAIATNAWRLLREWKTPPGTHSGTFSEELFTEWLSSVKESCEESGHLEVALISIGEVLIHSSLDPSGLWIHRAIGAALNDREADDMRRGFRTGMLNARGAHYVDPSGKPERELAEQFRGKAEEVENEGFQRLAATLRGLADFYDREAARIASSDRF